MVTKSNGKELTSLIIRIVLGAIAIGAVVYATASMVAKPGNTFAEQNKDLPANVQHIQKSLATIARVAEKLQELPAQVAHNKEDIGELAGVKTDLALTIQAMETLADGLGRMDQQVKQNTRWLLNLK